MIAKVSIITFGTLISAGLIRLVFLEIASKNDFYFILGIFFLTFWLVLFARLIENILRRVSKTNVSSN